MQDSLGTVQALMSTRCCAVVGFPNLRTTVSIVLYYKGKLEKA
jgi:hypothetical protein